MIVLMTDGQGNIARDGSKSRTRALEDTLIAARIVAAARLTVILIDIAPRQQTAARRLADAMHAAYLPLPHADARAVSAAVQATIRP